MQCTWPSSAQCQKIFKAIQYTNTTVNISLDDRGMHIMTMDSSKTSLVRLELTTSFFEQWSCAVPLTLGIHTETLSAALQKAKGARVSWRAQNDTTLEILFDKDSRTTSFALRSIDIEDDALDIPEMVDDVGLFTSDTVIKDWMDTVLMAKGDIAFQVSPQELACSASTIEFGDIAVKEPMQDGNIRLHNFKEDVDITLSFHAAKSFATFAACGKACFMGFSNQMPSRLKINLDDGDSYIALYVAPKIVDE